MTLATVRDQDRRRAAWLYDRAWGNSRKGKPRDVPDGTIMRQAATPLGDLAYWHLPGKKGAGTIVLSHPDRRYGGHWFVKEGWIEALQERGVGVVWFDQPGYGQGNTGSPFLYENLVTVCHAADGLDKGPLRLVGISLGAFTGSLAMAHAPIERAVLESPYPTFQDWYAGKGFSVDRLAISAWATMFRKSMPAVDAKTKFATTTQPVMVSWTRNDTTTAPELSQAVAALRGDVETYEGEAEHLHLWDEPEYRERVLEFLA